MIDLVVGASEQYINFTTSQKYTATEYVIRRIEEQEFQDLPSAEPSTLPAIPIAIRFAEDSSPEFVVKHLLFNGFLESPQEYEVDRPAPGIFELPLTILPLDVVQRALDFGEGAEFRFQLIIVEELNIQELTNSGSLRIEIQQGDYAEEDVLRVTNLAITRLGPVSIREFLQSLGNLEEVVVYEPKVEGVPNHQWHIEIDNISRQFTSSEYDDLIRRASQLAGDSLSQKITNHIIERFPAARTSSLVVRVIIEQLSPDQPVTIRSRRVSSIVVIDAADTLETSADRSHVLIMKGGGIKGLAYIGAVKELVGNGHYHFDWFVGTSAGAIAAALLATGYSASELEEIIGQKNFRDFFDAPLYKIPFNLLFYRFMFPGRAPQIWIDELIRDKLDNVRFSRPDKKARLDELPNKITVYASVQAEGTVAFDSTSELKPAPVSFAARCSMSIPIIFKPIEHWGNKSFDGGLRNNYPVNVFLADHPEARTKFIGLFLHPQDKKKKSRPNQSLLGSLYSLIFEVTDLQILTEHRSDSIVIDPYPIGMLNFKLSKLERQLLLMAGRSAALKFLHSKTLPNGPTKEDVLKAEFETERLRSMVIKRRRIKRIIFIGISCSLIALIVWTWIWH